MEARVTEIQSGDMITALDDAPLSRFHLRAVLVSGMGFFTDAYDLFVIGIASTLITSEWHLSSGRLALLNSTMLLTAGVSVAGLALTLVLPEPAGRSLEDIAHGAPGIDRTVPQAAGAQA
jgi:hypothetical protein